MSETILIKNERGEAGLAKIAQNKDWSDLLLIVRLINNPQVRKFTYDFLIHKVPDYFARIPASATGKYHPNYALGYGGLVRHTLVAAAAAYDISRLEYLRKSAHTSATTTSPLPSTAVWRRRTSRPWRRGDCAPTKKETGTKHEHTGQNSQDHHHHSGSGPGTDA